ncbi:FMN-dependent NADH-azoreductase [Acetobacter sp.]|uniref:FMN-dependent NADH-azoreductase n=1 Tax=Acetobacter sp. TaxID=440 RepID=UPI0039E8E406
MKILHIDCSPHRASHSRALSAAIVAQLRAYAPDLDTTHRDLGAGLVPPVDAFYATALARRPSSGDGELPGTMQCSETLIREIEASDAIVIGTPVHNFTVPTTLKAWIDHVVRLDRPMAMGSAGKIGLRADRPVFTGIAAARGTLVSAIDRGRIEIMRDQPA